MLLCSPTSTLKYFRGGTSQFYCQNSYAFERTSITETPFSYPTSTSDLFDIMSILFEDIPVYDTLPLNPFNGFPSSNLFILDPCAYTALLLIPDDHFLCFTAFPSLASSHLCFKDDESLHHVAGTTISQKYLVVFYPFPSTTDLTCTVTTPF